MSGAEIVAVVSVVVTGVVSPYIAQRWGMLRLRWETRRDRENRLVELMEKAALALVDAQIRVQDDLLKREQLDTSDATEEHKILLGNLWALQTQICLRLTTDSDEAEAFNDAASALARAYKILGAAMDGKPIRQEQLQAFNAACGDSSTAGERFQNAVARRIGPGETGSRAPKWLPPSRGKDGASP